MNQSQSILVAGEELFTSNDYHWMRLGLKRARQSAARGEVPVGAVLVNEENQLLASAGNVREKSNDPCGHAEIRVLRAAARRQKAWRLLNATLYVTLEPCIMCAGALIQARIGRVVMGCYDTKAGACGSLYQIHQDPRLNHRFKVHAGLLAEECREMLRIFFQMRRADNQKFK